MTGARSAIAKRLIVGETEAMSGVVDAMVAAAASDDPVLILGERGTGRELVARVIHFASDRADMQFLAVKAPGAGAPILDSGALDIVGDGTLLIKDAGALPVASQRALARMLKGKTAGRKSTGRTAASTRARIMTSSDPELEAVVEGGLFKRDLFNRLSTHAICLPSLREREADIPKLADHFVRKYSKEVGRRTNLSLRAYDRLIAYPWPGNIGELKDVARRLVIRVTGSRIEAGDVNQMLPNLVERVPAENMSFEDMVAAKLNAFLRRVEGYPLSGFYDEVMSRVERPLLTLVMDHTGGNQVRAAEILGVNRNTLRRKLAEHGIRARAIRAKRKATPASTSAAATKRKP